MAYSGGGYFRFFPFSFIKSRILRQDYSMCYFHINDLMPERSGVMTRKEYEDYFKESGTLKNRVLRYCKSNIRKSSAWGKLEKLVIEITFQGVLNAESKLDWSTCSLIKI